MFKPVKNLVSNEITWVSFFKIVSILLVIGLLVLIKEIAALLFLSYIAYAALNQLVENLKKVKIGNFSLNRGLSIFLVLLGTILILVFFIYGVISPTYQETSKLATDFESLWEDNIVNEYKLKEIIGDDRLLEIQSNIVTEVSENFSRLLNNPGSILNIGVSVFGGFLSLITIISITFYQLSEPGKVKSVIIYLFPKKNEDRVRMIMDEVETKLGFWLQGQLILMLAVGLFSYIGLRIIGIPFALPLAIIFGLLDILPIIGPIIAFFPLAIVAIALADSYWQVIAAMAFFILIQQIEGNFFVPKIMQKSVGLDPALVIAALMIGSEILGVIGAIISIPVAVIVSILFNYWVKLREEEEYKNGDTEEIKQNGLRVIEEDNKPKTYKKAMKSSQKIA